ncbi:hypothetical protein BDY24DRAFT_371920 [Mrakia frigida]|uniref:uncharacterized protein n=1 Tax=Mrakia frigida TaxID=29902 RepID=UPI003FCC19CE
MGVRGLTTYLKEQPQAFTRTTTFEANPDLDPSNAVALVVDAWSLIYLLYLDNIVWAYGGESIEWASLLQRTVEGWRAVGLEPVFVFDGPCPSIKHHTELTRQRSLLLPLSLFHLTSPESRSSPSFLHASKILPPLIYSATVDACLALKVECIWGEGEADELCVSEARKRNGWVTGMDSDFVVFSSSSSGAGGEMTGYVPLDGMTWKWLEPAEEQKSSPAAPAGTDDSGPWEGSFQAVKSRRRAPRTAYRNHCPNPPPLPHTSFLTSVTFTSYHADLLALRLKLPVGLLPLLAALVGNDYHQFSHLFHTKGTSGSQKIERVALALREALDPKIAARRAAAASAVKTFQNGRLIMTQGPKATTTTPVNGSAPVTPPSSGDAAATLLTSTVQSLLLHPVTEPQLDKLIHSLIDSALSYSVTHDFNTTSSYSLVTPSAFPAPAPTRDEIVALYADAMSKGEFAPKLAGVVRDGRYLGRVFLEDTQRGTIGRRVGEPIREMCWAILNQGVGIGYGKEVVVVEEEEEEIKDEETLEDGKSDGGAASQEDEDEIIEVAEEAFASDDPEDQVPTAASEDDDEEEEVDLPPSIQTYLRSSSLILPKMIAIPTVDSILLPTSSSPLTELPTPDLPLVLQPVEYRTQLYLALLNSLTPSILTLRDPLKPLVLALRWTMQVLSRDADVAAGGAKWMLRRGEVEAVVLAGVRSVRGWESWANALPSSPSSNNSDSLASSTTTTTHPEKLEITNRAVHITSHLLHSLHELSLLAQTLLLPSTLISPPHQSYSGRTFHTLLASPTTNSPQSAEEQEDFDATMRGVLDEESKAWLAPELEVGVDSAQARKDRKKAKKEKKRAGEAEGAGAKKGGGGGGGGMFAGLMEEDC